MEGPPDDKEHMMWEKDIEMGMVTKEAIPIPKQITPWLTPFASSLHSSLLSTHCYSCFRRVDDNLGMSPCRLSFITYCSTECEDIDFTRYLKSGEHSLLLHLDCHPEDRLTDYFDTSYIRLALRFLHLFPSDQIPDSSKLYYYQLPDRICSLSWVDADQFLTLDFEKATSLMHIAKCLVQGKSLPLNPTDMTHMRVLTLVLTNALSVCSLLNTNDHLDSNSLGVPLGFALYDYHISWINHSCAPNSRVQFQIPRDSQDEDPMLIEPTIVQNVYARRRKSVVVSGPCNLPVQRNYGPRASIETIKMLEQGEEVTISYIADTSSMGKVERYARLMEQYRFTCFCNRCQSPEAEDGDHDGSGITRHTTG